MACFTESPLLSPLAGTLVGPKFGPNIRQTEGGATPNGARNGNTSSPIFTRGEVNCRYSQGNHYPCYPPFTAPVGRRPSTHNVAPNQIDSERFNELFAVSLDSQAQSLIAGTSISCWTRFAGSHYFRKYKHSCLLKSTNSHLS